MKEVTQKVIGELIDKEDKHCVSMFMSANPVAGPEEIKKMQIKLKNLINETKKWLKAFYKMDELEIKDFLKLANELLGDLAFWQKQKGGLAIFINSNHFLYYRVPISLNESVELGSHFNIIPLIPEIIYDDDYYLLAISKNKNRFYKCSKGSIKQIEVPGVPENFAEIMQYDDSEKQLQYHSHKTESYNAIFHGRGVVDEDKKDELLQYLRKIDQGFLKYIEPKEKSPMLLMCVEALFPLYRQISTYPFLMDKFIEGNPDKMQPQEINRKAWNIVKEHFQNKMQGVIKQYHNLKGTGKTSNQLEDIIAASMYSRISRLFLKKNISRKGYFDSNNNQILVHEENPKNEDLFNLTAINTLKNGGNVYVLDVDQMPDQEEIVAIYRY